MKAQKVAQKEFKLKKSSRRARNEASLFYEWEGGETKKEEVRERERERERKKATPTKN